MEKESKEGKGNKYEYDEWIRNGTERNGVLLTARILTPAEPYEAPGASHPEP